jgi:hypothetical protein
MTTLSLSKSGVGSTWVIQRGASPKNRPRTATKTTADVRQRIERDTICALSCMDCVDQRYGLYGRRIRFNTARLPTKLAG